MDDLIPAITTAGTVATLLQLLKNSPLIPWINRDTGRVNALIGIVAAGLTTIGLSYSYTFDAETGRCTLGFVGSMGGIVDGLAHWFGQWLAQQAYYKGFIVPAEALGEMRAVMKEGLLHQPPQLKAEIPPVTPKA